MQIRSVDLKDFEGNIMTRRSIRRIIPLPREDVLNRTAYDICELKIYNDEDENLYKNHNKPPASLTLHLNSVHVDPPFSSFVL